MNTTVFHSLVSLSFITRPSNKDDTKLPYPQHWFSYQPQVSFLFLSPDNWLDSLSISAWVSCNPPRIQPPSRWNCALLSQTYTFFFHGHTVWNHFHEFSRAKNVILIKRERTKSQITLPKTWIFMWTDRSISISSSLLQKL